MEKPEPPLTREDFLDYEDWIRHCHLGGIDPAAEDPSFSGLGGVGGDHARVVRSVLGGSNEPFERSWAGRGISLAISPAQLKQLYRAVAFANCRGVVMDTTVDITWSLQGAGRDLVVKSQQKKLFDHVRRWLEHKRLWPAYAWVLERGSTRGLHTHAMFHVPRGLEDQFERYVKDLIKRITNNRLMTTPHEASVVVDARPGTNVVTQWIRFRYMLKGIDDRLAWRDKDRPSGFLRLYQRAGLTPAPQGELVTKRVGVSRTLDASSYEEWSAINDFPPIGITQFDQAAYDDRYIRWHREHASTLRDPGGKNGNRRGPKTEMERELRALAELLDSGFSVKPFSLLDP